MIFSIASLFVLFGIASFLWIGSTMLISAFLAKIIGAYSINQILPILIGIVALLNIPMGIMRFKRFRNKEWVKRNYYPLFKKMNQAILFLFYKPLSLLTYAIFTNLKRTNLYYFFVFIIGIFFVSAYNTEQSNISFSKSNLFARMSTTKNHIESQNYSQNNIAQNRILHPQIESRIITNNFIKLFIPIFKREKPHISKICPKFSERIKGRRSISLREKNNDRRLDCYKKYYTISVDSNIVLSTDMLLYTHPNRSEKGLLCVIPIDSISKGRHSIQIKKPYLTEDSDMVSQVIQFWKE